MDHYAPQPKPPPPDPRAPKITTQYRAKHAMIYELETRGRGFEIRIWNTDEEGDAAWHVEARNGFGEEATLHSATGATASEALDAVASACREAGTAGAFVDLDWEAVARVLGSVRAI